MTLQHLIFKIVVVTVGICALTGCGSKRVPPPSTASYQEALTSTIVYEIQSELESVDRIPPADEFLDDILRSE